MAKKGKLSKVEEFYITNNRDKGVDVLAKELDRTQAIVQKTLDSTEATEKTEEESVKKDGVASVYPGQAGKMMGRHKRNGKNVATVMTPGASQASDEHRQQIGSTRHMNENTIHKPLGED